MEKNRITSASVIVLIMLIVLFMSGCKSNRKKYTLVDSKELISGINEYPDEETIQYTYSKKIRFEVNNILWNKTTGVADVVVEYPDLYRIISQSIDKAITKYGEEDYDLLKNKVKNEVEQTLNSKDCPFAEKNIKMQANKNNDGYVLVSNEDFEKILQGNLEEVFIRTIVETYEND